MEVEGDAIYNERMPSIVTTSTATDEIVFPIVKEVVNKFTFGLITCAVSVHHVHPMTR